MARWILPHARSVGRYWCIFLYFFYRSFIYLFSVSAQSYGNNEWVCRDDGIFLLSDLDGMTLCTRDGSHDRRAHDPRCEGLSRENAWKDRSWRTHEYFKVRSHSPYYSSCTSEPKFFICWYTALTLIWWCSELESTNPHDAFFQSLLSLEICCYYGVSRIYRVYPFESHRLTMRNPSVWSYWMTRFIDGCYSEYDRTK